MSRENKTKYAILGLLASCDMSGYDIKKSFENGMDLFWRENYGQIYPLLKALSLDGLIEEAGVISQEGKPDKRMYRITARGKEALVSWLNKPADQELFRVELLLKLSFGMFMEDRILLQHIGEYRERYAGLLRDLENIEQRVTEKESHKEHYRYSMATISYGKHLAQAMLDWCKKTQNSWSGEGQED